MKKALASKWSTDVGLSALLAALVVGLFVVRPLEELGLTGGVLMEIFFAGVLVAGVWTVWTRRAQAIIFGSAVGIAEVVRWVNWVAPTAGLAPWAALCSCLAFGLLMFLVLKWVFLPGPITPHRIQGAVAVYLLIGVMWPRPTMLSRSSSPRASSFRAASRAPAPGPRRLCISASSP